MPECVVYSYHKCVVCEQIGECAVGKLVLKKPTSADRSPDALTNDFIYCRGEFDPFIKVTKREIKRCSDAFKDTVNKFRKESGLST